MGWLYLMLAIGLEVGGTTSMKLSEGFTRWVPSVAMFVLYGCSLVMLNLALHHKIEIGVAYAVWAGVGVALIAGIGCAFFGESLTAIKVGCIGLIAAGVVGLNLWGGAHAGERPPAPPTPDASRVHR
jgi:small multidrug resistance pump